MTTSAYMAAEADLARHRIDLAAELFPEERKLDNFAAGNGE
jgi:hypothetical protein